MTVDGLETTLPAIYQTCLERTMRESNLATVRLHCDDNVVVAIAQIHPGMSLAGESLEAAGWISAGHKIATAAIASGAPIRKYGQIIGFASRDIGPDEHVHVHNCTMGDPRQEYEFCVDAMDINCGEILGGRSVEEMGEAIFSLMLRGAGGEPSKSEALGFGDTEFVPWQIGPVM